MVGLLYALPNTQLTRRLAKEGRLQEGHDVMREDRTGDQCTCGINFDPLRPMRDILRRLQRILEQRLRPVGLCGRLDRLAAMLDRSGRRTNCPRAISAPKVVARIVHSHRPCRRPASRSGDLSKCAKSNPAALRYIVLLMALYIHLGPFARKVIARSTRGLRNSTSWRRHQSQRLSPSPALYLFIRTRSEDRMEID